MLKPQKHLKKQAALKRESLQRQIGSNKHSMHADLILGELKNFWWWLNVQKS